MDIEGGNGHSFVVGKDKNDILYVWDPQQSIFKTGYDGLHDYMKKGEYITMYYITKKADKQEEVLNLIDPVLVIELLKNIRKIKKLR